MRGILLSLASFVVGSATMMAVVGVGSAGAGFEIVLAAGVVWSFALVIGILLSAPFFLNPPDFVAGWSMTLPLPLWVVVGVFKLISWVGLMILRVAWAVIGLAVNGVRDSIGHGVR
jgi:hypothetical protein